MTGETVEIFDGKGGCVEAEIVEISKDRVELVARRSMPDRSPTVNLTLLVAVPKGERFDWLVEKATELGVARLVPLKAARSVVDPRMGKLERLRRVILEASKQSGRSRLMTLEEPVTVTEAIRRESSDIRFIAEAGGLSCGEWPWKQGGSVALAIGPEGGWTAEEVALTRDLGWTTVGLGATRLRVETAAIVGAGVIFSKSERSPS